MDNNTLFIACRTWFTAPNGYTESYTSRTWNEYHILVQAMEGNGWTKTQGGIWPQPELGLKGCQLRACTGNV